MKVFTGVCLILGCFLGAGFVSGREVAFYFARFGWASMLSIILSSILFCLLLIYFFYLSSICNNINSFCSNYFGKMSVVINWMLAICVLILSSSMLAGTTTLAEVINLNPIIFLIISLILAFCVVAGEVKFLSKINVVLMPMIIIILLIVMSRGGDNLIHSGNEFKAIIYGVDYVFINIVTLGMFIIEIGNSYSRKQGIIISIISSIVIAVMTICIAIAIMGNGLMSDGMPNLTLSQNNNVLYLLMQISIYFGLFTTLVANVLVLSNFVNKYVSNYYISIIITLILSFVLSAFGFEVIVGYIYSIIAFVGLFMIGGAMISSKKRRFQVSSKII